jgi:hypothetical protein
VTGTGLAMGSRSGVDCSARVAMKIRNSHSSLLKNATSLKLAHRKATR